MSDRPDWTPGTRAQDGGPGVRVRVLYDPETEQETTFGRVPVRGELIENGLMQGEVMSVIHHPGVHDGVYATIYVTAIKPIRDVP